MQARQYTAAWSGVKHQTAPCWQAGIRWGGSAAMRCVLWEQRGSVLPCYMHGPPLGSTGATEQERRGGAPLPPELPLPPVPAASCRRWHRG